ncbi:hypothetical protein PAXRUDRAFT_36832 [Paxillus rubicundulus Ve08.2h10]|uniref:Uncharacterized protein n=1 Tax=Paxillus rubicundulus Ve08.2h10 TaxID=930991 RepID=A0A0D0D0M3_9AGAM|nr:hypothetical protein PAXRUDRAFT_36832 [Paxillus rubicundulus Ve08.2h10]
MAPKSHSRAYSILQRITISSCHSQCGTGQEPFDWETSSQDFAVWLFQPDNLVSAVLTVGSPARTVRETVVGVLGSLPPSRTRPGEAAVFESLVIPPENDKWWTMFDESLNYTHTWSISSATSIAWVIVAFLLTVPDPLFELHADRDPTRPNVSVIVDFEDEDLSSPDEARTPPVFNYSRALSWSRSVYVASLFYDAAWSRAQDSQTVDNSDWTRGKNADVRDDSGETVDRSLNIVNQGGTSVESVGRLASLVTLILQWGTTGAALLAVWFTLTTKLGCRSMAYLIYGASSTLAWILLVLSSVFHGVKEPAMTISRYLRWAGKTLASENAVFIIAISVFQYASVFDRYHCNSSVIGWGDQAYDIVVILYADVAQTRAASIGGCILAYIY